MELTPSEKKEVLDWIDTVVVRVATDPRALIPKEVLNAMLKATNWPRPYLFDITRPQLLEEAMKIVGVVRERLQSIATVQPKNNVIKFESRKRA